MSRIPRFSLQVLWFFAGLLVCALGYVLIIKAGLGASPWDIFHLGIKGHLHIGLGLAVQGTGVVIILLNRVLGIRPTLGMVLNMLAVGPMEQFVLGLLPQPETVFARWTMLALGLVLSGIGTGLYASADLGTGPRDGMMIGLTRKLGRPVGLIKNGIDVIISLTGWWLGGPLGIGTLVVMVSLGWTMQLGMHLAGSIARLSPFSGFLRPVALKRASA